MGVPPPLSKKKDDKKEMINMVVLETGYSRKMVDDIITSFIGAFQEKATLGKAYIKGFGELSSTLIQRKYYNINSACVSLTDPRPTVKFRPTKSFLNLIKSSSEPASTTQGNGESDDSDDPIIWSPEA